MYLLYPQTQVEDAVRAVGLPVGTSRLSDEVGQSVAQLSRVALEDVFFDINWMDGSTTMPYTGSISSGVRERRFPACSRKVEEVELRLTLCRALVPSLDPALPGFDPIEVVHFGGIGNRCGTTVRCGYSPATLDRHKCNEF